MKHKNREKELREATYHVGFIFGVITGFLIMLFVFTFLGLAFSNVYILGLGSTMGMVSFICLVFFEQSNNYRLELKRELDKKERKWIPIK